MTARWSGFPRRLLILPLEALIVAYRITLSPVMGRQCRYVPTCSVYAHEALIEHGPIRGCVLAARRILRCHPLAPGGYDPVPVGSGASSEAKHNLPKGIGAAGKCSLDCASPAAASGGKDADGDAASGGAADEPTSRGQAT